MKEIPSYKFKFSLGCGFLFAITLLPCIAIAQSSTEAAQVSTADKVKNHDSIPQQEDIVDFFIRLTKINIKHKEDSEAVRPGKILPAVFPAIGYTQINGIVGVVAANLSFYTGDIHLNNLSTVTASPTYSQHKQIIIPINSTIWFDKNKFDLLGDYRFYKYPSFTYGLGGLSSIDNQDRIDYSFAKISQEILMRLAKDLYGGVGYALDYHFNIEDLGSLTDFQLYNNYATTTTSSGLTVHLKYDSRKNINNPKNEFFASVIFRDNYTWLGSDQNWQSLQFEFRKYIKLSPNKNRVLAFWSWDNFTFGKAPYLDLPSTGWDTYSNTGRGYIQGRYRGTDLLYLESEYRFDITRNGLLGGVLFVNAQSVPEWPSGQFKSVNPAEGFGLRLKLNRYSDTNLCVDYAFGTEGAQGIYFNLGEVF